MITIPRDEYYTNDAHEKIPFFESDWLRAMQFLVSAMQKRKNKNENISENGALL